MITNENNEDDSGFKSILEEVLKNSDYILMDLEEIAIECMRRYKNSLKPNIQNITINREKNKEK